eukprot:TRINITY_DN2528_c0_g1_i1.p1 TRINITY_DN2528_c0_g1~~TRINITY_DN2528_c0_g1_i1.p1  ORF type:complete len:481 (-),score=161.31 TRINITY_DN2528_c0_g1_i1:30-1337(-)
MNPNTANAIYAEILQERETILKEQIPWQGYQNAGLLSAGQVNLIATFCAKEKEGRSSTFDSDQARYAQLFLKILQSIHKKEPMQYILTLMDDLLEEKPSRIEIFLDGENPLVPFLKLLSRQELNWYSRAKACKISALLLVNSKKVSEEDLTFFMHWCRDQLAQKQEHDLDVGITGYQVLLVKPEFRVLLVQDDGLNMLSSLLDGQLSNSQLIYQTIYCLWLLSFQEEIAVKFPSRAVKTMVEVLRTAAKDKLVRIILATLVNLLNKGENNQAIVYTGILRILTNLNNKKWADEDITTDLNTLTESVQKIMADMSSFEVFKTEVLSGVLEWSPAHRSENFWKENIFRFEDKQFELIGVLKQILKTPNVDNTTLAVALHDIGEFVRFYPQGRSVINRMQMKEMIMAYMVHHDPEVQKHALLCTQKLMVTNWEYLSKS